MMEMEIKAQEILEVLNKHNFHAFFVGGYVRDKLLERTTNDIDIATSARPEEIESLFSHCIPTGIQHGTVTVIIDRIPFEVTTFRSEKDYEDFRRPRTVEYETDIVIDLERRDFTINAMAMDQHGSLIDPFGGKNDLEQRRLTCVGNPVDRFQEDALRILRCIRFAAEYGLTVEPETWQAVLAEKPLLQHIAIERVRTECEKMLEGSDPDRAFRLMIESNLLQHVKHSIKIASMDVGMTTDLSGHTIFQNVTPPTLRWCVFFWMLQYQSEQAQQKMNMWTFSNQKTERIVKVMKFHEQSIANSLEYTLEKQRQVFVTAVIRSGKESAEDWTTIMRQSAISFPSLEKNEEVFRYIRKHAYTWLHQIPIFRIRDLHIDGHDIATMSSRRSGPWIRELLQLLLTRVAVGDIKNENADLQAIAVKQVKEWEHDE